MATYIVTINEKTSAGKSVLNLLKSLRDIVTIKSNGIDESLEEVHKGKVSYAQNAKDLINQCTK